MTDRKIEDRITARMKLPPGPIEAGSIWTPSLVDARLEEASRALDALPSGLRQRITLKVDVVHAASDAYGYTNASARVLPSSEAIDRAYEAINWLQFLSQRDRTLVWARALGIKWSKLEGRLGFSERRLSTFRRNAILQIVARLNGVTLPRAT
jgi:hypothetical protein